MGEQLRVSQMPEAAGIIRHRVGSACNEMVADDVAMSPLVERI
jgi:hypothetical protein